MIPIGIMRACMLTSTPMKTYEKKTYRLGVRYLIIVVTYKLCDVAISIFRLHE